MTMIPDWVRGHEADFWITDTSEMDRLLTNMAN
jgi:hypothetical protein